MTTPGSPANARGRSGRAVAEFASVDADRTVDDDRAPDDEDAIALDPDEASIVAAEAVAAAGVLPEGLRDDALALAEVAPSGSVPPALLETLEHLAVTSLAGGRARRLYRAEGERLLGAVLARTPGGRARRQSLDGVNRALGALGGRRLQGVRVATRVPGTHTVRIEADGVTLTLGLSGGGVTVENLAL